MNVFQKINEVKKVVRCLSKDAETTGNGAYLYISGSQILGAIKEKMEDVGLLFLPVETEHRSWDIFNYKNSYGNEKTDFIVNGKLSYEWINIDEPTDRQRVNFEFYGQQNDISKAFGSGLTYSERYLLLKSLGAPTDEDDPDKITENKSQKKMAQPQETAQSQNQNIPSNKPPAAQCQSKWVVVNTLIRDTKIPLASVNEWIKKAYKSNIKINDLSEEQFMALTTALKAKIINRDEKNE